MQIDKDAFSSGQVLSKLWLAEKLENYLEINQKINQEFNILALGGWYGILHFILRCRSKIKISSYRNLDIDPSVADISEGINEAWLWQNWKFKTVTVDANDYEYSIDQHNLIINTSVEHIDSKKWFNNIPESALVILQSNDMEHSDHSSNHTSLENFVSDFSLSEIFYTGQKLFQYDQNSFRRFMLIGRK